MRFSVSILALLTLPWTGCGDGVQMTSTSSTNATTGAVKQRDVYTRDGQTNLIRNRMTLKDGTIEVLAHRIYREGQIVAMISDVQGSFNIMTEPDSPYGISVEFHPDRTVRAVVLMSTKGDIADMFLATNKVIVPVNTSDLQKAQGIGKVATESMSGATNKTSSEFYDEVEDLIEESQE